MAWFKDDNSLSNSNLLNRWNLIKAERNRLLEEQQASTDEYMKSDEQISHEKFHEQCNFEKDAIIPLLPANSPLSSPASTTKVMILGQLRDSTAAASTSRMKGGLETKALMSQSILSRIIGLRLLARKFLLARRRPRHEGRIPKFRC